MKSKKPINSKNCLLLSVQLYLYKCLIYNLPLVIIFVSTQKVLIHVPGRLIPGRLVPGRLVPDRVVQEGLQFRKDEKDRAGRVQRQLLRRLVRILRRLVHILRRLVQILRVDVVLRRIRRR